MKETLPYSRSHFFEKKVSGSNKATNNNGTIIIMFCIVIVWLVAVPLLIFLIEGK
ncbi:MAG: hypothetical protein V4643_08995 [Bacteroidota bacterium]